MCVVVVVYVVVHQQTDLCLFFADAASASRARLLDVAGTLTCVHAPASSTKNMALSSLANRRLLSSTGRSRRHSPWLERART